MINGYLPVGPNTTSNYTTSLFFTLFSKKNETIDDFSPETPVLFWFDGGPVILNIIEIIIIIYNVHHLLSLLGLFFAVLFLGRNR